MQGGASGDLFTRLLPWLGGLVALAVVGGILMAWTRRMAVGRDAASNPHGFGLDELEAMKARGEISPDEYERARRRMVDREASRARRPSAPSGKGR